MNLEERIYSVLLVSAAEKFNTSLKELLPDFKFYPIQEECSTSSAKRALADRSYDFIIINSPLPDSDGIRLAIDTSNGKNSVVLFLVRNDLYTTAFEKISVYGAYTLSKPTSKQIINQALDWMISTRERLRGLEKKSLSLENKMQEIRIVNRAKWLLISELKMTESDAHRYIEKHAMDRCIPKQAMAEEIISLYT
ncbi:MAG: ANTAR domain-containing protein [Clostridia bacterium]|nr:ANTAR domain-containing protein [Clostridia bacterium]